MINTLIADWNKFEASYMDFCFDLFDDEKTYRMGQNETKHILDRFNIEKVSLFEFVEKIVVCLMRYVLVRKLIYDNTALKEQDTFKLFTRIKAMPTQRALHCTLHEYFNKCNYGLATKPAVYTGFT